MVQDDEPKLPQRPSQIFGKMKLDPNNLKVTTQRLPGQAQIVILKCEYHVDSEEFEVTDFEFILKATRGSSSDAVTHKVDREKM